MEVEIGRGKKGRRAYGFDHREAQNGAYYTRRYRELKAELLAE